MVFFFRRYVFGEQDVQQLQHVGDLTAEGPPQTDYDGSHKIVVSGIFLGRSHQILFGNAVAGNGISSLFGWIRADPDTVDLFNIFVVGADEFSSVLGRNHSAAVVDSSLDQRIAGIEIVLRLHVDDKLRRTAGDGDRRFEANIVSHPPFCGSHIFTGDSPDQRRRFLLKYGRMDRHSGDLKMIVDVFPGNFFYRIVPEFFQAVFQDPGQYNFL